MTASIKARVCPSSLSHLVKWRHARSTFVPRSTTLATKSFALSRGLVGQKRHPWRTKHECTSICLFKAVGSLFAVRSGPLPTSLVGKPIQQRYAKAKARRSSVSTWFTQTLTNATTWSWMGTASSMPGCPPGSVRRRAGNPST